MNNMMKTVLMFLWKSLVGYIVKRCTGTFMDSAFDILITEFAKATPSKIDDELLEKWKERKGD